MGLTQNPLDIKLDAKSIGKVALTVFLIMAVVGIVKAWIWPLAARYVPGFSTATGDAGSGGNMVEVL